MKNGANHHLAIVSNRVDRHFSMAQGDVASSASFRSLSTLHTNNSGGMVSTTHFQGQYSVTRKNPGGEMVEEDIDAVIGGMQEALTDLFKNLGKERKDALLEVPKAIADGQFALATLCDPDDERDPLADSASLEEKEQAQQDNKTNFLRLADEAAGAGVEVETHQKVVEKAIASVRRGEK